MLQPTVKVGFWANAETERKRRAEKRQGIVILRERTATGPLKLLEEFYHRRRDGSFDSVYRADLSI
jgi:hypothetical protein